MNASGRRRFASGRTRLVLMALAALFILSMVCRLASAYVEHEHAAVVVQFHDNASVAVQVSQKALTDPDTSARSLFDRRHQLVVSYTYDVARTSRRRGAVGACSTCGRSTGLFGRRLGELELWSGRHRPWNADHTIDATPGRQGGGSECRSDLQAGQVI